MKHIEQFCSACATIPLSFASSALGNHVKKNHDYSFYKDITLILSLMITFISFSFGYYKFFLSDCKTCKL